MSKMPAKKKSCFQITSVTQAQVAAVGAADDTESLDDPDESRTEDVSSEIYDMPRADYEPACDISSSEEALNNVVEPEAVGVMPPSSVPHASQLSALSSNPSGDFRKVGVSGSSQGGQQAPGIGAGAGLPLITQAGPVQQQQPASAASAGPASASVNTSQPAAVPSSAPPPATSTVSCSSRFRVIKLDHGTGEPFRRGRWTCTEFYEKDSESSVVGRTVDSMRHANTALDPAADRDSGLGLTGGSAATSTTPSSHGLGSMADSSLSSSRVHSVEAQPPQQQIHHQNYSARQQGVSGSVTHSSFSRPTAVPAQPAVAGLQPLVPQNLLPVEQNGPPQSGVLIQKSPIMPLSVQPSPYPPQQQQQQQLPVGQHLAGQSPGLMQNQAEYYQQHHSAPLPPGLASGQPHPVSSQGQGPTSVMPTASGGASAPSQAVDVLGAAVGGVLLPAGQPAPTVLQQQTVGMGAAGGPVLVGGSALKQQTVNLYATAGQPQPHGHPPSSGVQNVPAIAVSSSVPPTVPTVVPSASSAAKPNVTTPSLPPGQIAHSNTAGALGPQGLPVTAFGQVEAGGGRKSDGIINIQSPVVSVKEPAKPFMPESLQLTTPTVNSIFAIHIPVDGEEDSASGTNVVAIDNKIEQAMDLVKSHLMYAVREEVEVLKEQIKELYERNSVLERENAVLKSLANSEQLSQLSTQSTSSSGAAASQPGLSQPQQQAQPPLQVQPPSQSHPQLQHHPQPQQLQTQPQLDPSQQLQPNVTSA
ncbi:TSC22 domain family protein 2-like isoform X2 [Astatotilapia calliptera]|uniref:TSC22 domain family member 2 n=1 Tax=Astatotilapia calliptera TaxID=8154 RepID=A0A3P8PI78_ASTCA|nr:TSC22 domain family protein 2-like isoform X2 [Astatotilapia calliptera]